MHKNLHSTAALPGGTRPLRPASERRLPCQQVTKYLFQNPTTTRLLHTTFSNTFAQFIFQPRSTAASWARPSPPTPVPGFLTSAGTARPSAGDFFFTKKPRYSLFTRFTLTCFATSENKREIAIPDRGRRA